MANKPFSIQESKVRIAGVDLEAGNTGVVIPGVTQATSYKVEEVEDNGEQTHQFTPNSDVVVIDLVLYNAIIEAGNESLYADFTATTDDNGYIDEIRVNGQGTYTQPESFANGTNNMKAYIGTGSASDRPLVEQDWISIPFRPKMRAGEIETISGGIGNLTMDTPWLILSQDSNNFLDLAPSGQLRLVGGEGNQVQIASNYNTANQQIWNFNPDGTMSFPDGTQQVTAYDPQVVPGLNNHRGYESSGNSDTTIKVVVPAQSIVVLALAAENANGQSINAVNVFGAGLDWSLRTRYTDPDSPVHQTSELWYAINDSDSTMAGIVTIVYENEFDDQTSSYAVFGQVDLNNPWTQATSVGVSTIDGGNRPTATFSTPETNTITLAFIATSVSTNRTTPSGFTLIEDVSNSGAEFWEYSTLSYKIYDTAQTDTVLTGVDTIELVPNGESDARGYTFIVDALVLTGPIGDSIDSLINGNAVVSLDSNGVIHLPVGGDIVDSNGTSVLGGGAQLVGDGFVAGTGSKVIVYSDYQGFQGGESTGVIIPTSKVNAFTVGDIITFRNGEVRTISGVDPNFGDNTWVQWNESVTGDWNNPRFPMTFTSADYIPDTKLTARIKPDLSTEGSGQYMNVYVGGTQVLDHKHVHMAGHEADTELFLGTDNNFISTKEAGRSPAHVNLKSENDITVSETNLRMSRGNNWVSVYGDGQNREWRDNTQDLTWNVIESDDQGNYYVGGEATWNADAMVAKYGPDGDLVWKKIVNNDNTAGWDIGGVAHNPVDKEVAFAVRTDQNRNNQYYKVNVLDSNTGDVKRVFDVYDPDGGVSISNMAWHPTLGFMAVGSTSGESATTGPIASVSTDYNYTTATDTMGSNTEEVTITDGGSLPSVVPQVGDSFTFNGGDYVIASVNTYATYYGLVVSGLGAQYAPGLAVILHRSSSTTGIIELPRTSVKIGGRWPQFWSNWYISGTNISGSQNIQGGVGLYFAPVINLTNPSSTGMTAGIRVDYSNVYYENYASGNPGTGTWDNGDNFKILGSSLGGIDGGTVGSFNQVTNNGGTVYFSQVDYPSMNMDVTAGTLTRFSNFAEGTVSAVSDAGDGNWAVDVTMNQGQSMATGSVIFYHGNDITGLIADINGIQNGFIGTPSLTSNYHIDMGYNMGYGSTNFARGVFTISTTLSNQSFVWNENWSKVFEAENGGQSYAYSIAVDKVWGDIVVGGYEEGTNRNFVWKLTDDGTTQWIKRIDDDSYNNVTSVAISSVNRSVYFATRFNSVNKLDMYGNFMKRVEPSGPWGHNSPIVKLEQSIDGEEYVYVGGSFGSMWGNGYMINKLDSNLEIIWSRDIKNVNRDLNVHYGDFHNNFALGRDRAVLVGYTYIGSFNYYNGFLASISTGDNFEIGQIDDWYIENPGGAVQYQDQTSNYNVENCLVNGATTVNSTMQIDNNVDPLDWTNWAWKTAPVKLDLTVNGIVGVETIAFAEGGLLDHNPSDIPPVLTDFDVGNGWNYTLKLSDRGKFIMNGTRVEDYTNNLYIHVPTQWNVTFPVGSVITLINVSDVNSSGNRIYVQPENYSSNDCPRIYATGFGSTWSTWSFPGVQTATLMKIGSNEWLLTANDIQNED